MKAQVLKRVKTVLVVFGASVLFTLAVQPSAYAATFTVNRDSDAHDASPGNGTCAIAGGGCTLRAAIEENNAGNGGNTITIPAYTIVLSNSSGYGELAVTKSVTINGAGQGSTIIDGNHATRVFNFKVWSGAHSVSGLTIRNGNCTPCTDRAGGVYWNGGGGIFNEATLTLTNVTVTGSTGTQGGGIFNEMHSDSYIPTLTLNSVTITNNTSTALVGDSVVPALGGGGIFNGGALTGSNVTITGNTAFQGGGIFSNSNSNIVFADFTISNNVAKEGGGIDNDYNGGSSSFTLNNGTLSGNISNCCNTVNGTNTGGGAIYNNEGTMYLNDVTLSDNQATSGQGFGGGIVNVATGAMTLNRVAVSGNRASYGAGLYNGSTLNITNATLHANIGTGVSSGGALFNTGAGQTVLTGVTINANTSSEAGGIDNSRNVTSGTVRLSNTILIGNQSTYTQQYGNPRYGPNCQGTIASTGYNLIGITGGCTFGATTGDQTNVADAGLGPLWNNGGATKTQMLLSGSPAVNAGALTGCPTTDQRGITRPQSGRCDIGAYELRAGVDQWPAPSLLLPMLVR